MRSTLTPQDWQRYSEIYQRNTRAATFFQMVIDDATGIPSSQASTILDIGCGGGFHHEKSLQRRIGSYASRFIGVEPDPSAQIEPCFAEVLQTCLETADIESESVDLAYSSMVLEHVADGELHFAKIHTLLKPGGVFWGFTVDKRHWFSAASSLLEKTGLKDTYLRLLHGERGVDRYENFPTHYNCNSPRQLRRIAHRFTHIQTISLHKTGQLDFYFPRPLHPISHGIDRLTVAMGLPGSVLVVRLVK